MRPYTRPRYSRPSCIKSQSDTPGHFTATLSVGQEGGAPEGGGLDRPLGVGGDAENYIHGTERCRSTFTRRARAGWRLARASVAGTRATLPATDRCPRSLRTRFAASPACVRLLEGRARRLVGAVQDPVGPGQRRAVLRQGPGAADSGGHAGDRGAPAGGGPWMATGVWASAIAAMCGCHTRALHPVP